MDESIGAKLRQARERRSLNLQQVSESTKVRPHYLQALENDDLSAIPSAAQARGFLGIYAGFLGLDLGELVPAARPTAPTPPVVASSDSPAVETPNQPGAPRFGIRAWAGEHWSKLAGKPTRERRAASPDRSVQSETSTTEPSAPGVASEPGSSSQSQVSTTDPGESTPFNPRNERAEELPRIPPPLASRIRGMFLDTTVERTSSSDEVAGDTSSQPESEPHGVASSGSLPADAKKKAGP